MCSSAKLIFLLLLIVPKCCEFANILYVMSFPGRSHYIMLKPVALELARRGHNVTVITPFLETDHPPNYHQVRMDNKTIWDVIGDKIPNIFTMVDISFESLYSNFWNGGLAITELALNSTEVKKFMAKDNQFDLVVSQIFSQEALYMLAYKYKAPLILISTIGNNMKHNILTRNPLQLASVMFDSANLEDPASFLGRFKNLYCVLYEYFWWMFWYLEKQEQLVKKYMPDLPSPVPSLYEIQRNTSLFLSNSHFSFDAPVAYHPNIVEIGGVHLNQVDNKPLSNDLQKLLDEAEQGVVYVSFGSNLRSAELPKDKKDTFLKVFSRLNQTVLWKWEDDDLGKNLDNVVTRKWFPQKEILAHPNVKLFVSHGGMISTQEAIYYGVPILGIPIYADQYKNILNIETIGSGRRLLFQKITQDSFENLLNEMLHNHNYKEKAMDLSVRFKDRPMKALDTAVFWIEYVIRHKGVVYVKNPAKDLSWVAYNMLDVYVFTTLPLLIIIIIIVRVLKSLVQVKDAAHKEKRS